MVELSVDYIRGFVDGEGSFYVSLQHNAGSRVGFQVIPMFMIGLSHGKKNQEVLEGIKRTLGIGKVYVGSYNVKYVVENVRDLNRYVIPFFEKNSLILKNSDFEVWKEIVKHVNRGNHLTRYGLRTYIIPLIEKLYTLRKERSQRTILMQMKKALGLNEKSESAEKWEW
jgi:hypothetical protein